MEKPKCSLLAMLPKPKNITSDKSKSSKIPNISVAVEQLKPPDSAATNNVGKHIYNINNVFYKISNAFMNFEGDCDLENLKK